MIVESAKYTLDPGQEVQYLYTPSKPGAALAVTRIVPHYGPGTHHVVLWHVPGLFAGGLPADPYESPEISPLGHIPLYVGGTSETPLEAPPGSAFNVAADEALEVQLHLLNASSAPATGKATLDLYLTEAEHVPANVYAFDNATFEIPPHASAFETSVTCTLAADLDVFAVWPHMHSRGRSMRVERNGAAWWSIDQWAFNDQPIAYFDGHLAAGDVLKITCVFDNDSDSPVARGTSGALEMCSWLAYHSGPSATKFYACVDGQTIAF